MGLIFGMSLMVLFSTSYPSSQKVTVYSPYPADAPLRVQQMFDACANRYAAHRLYGKLFHGRIAGRLLGASHAPILFRGAVIEHSNVVIDLKPHPDVEVEVIRGGQPHYAYLFAAE